MRRGKQGEGFPNEVRCHCRWRGVVGGGGRGAGFGRPKGRVTLTSTDPNVQPFLDYRLLSDAEDRRRMREAVRIAVGLFEHPDMAATVRERFSPPDSALESDDALDEWLLREVTTGQHLTGTCKMGPASDPLAVVDQRLRAHGLENLRVADASIMPDTARANTNATTMMIGERAADFVLRGGQGGDWTRGRVTI